MRAFFLASLLLPIAVAYTSYVISPLNGMYFLWQFAQIPYVATVALLALFFWRAKTVSRILILSIIAPLLMGALEWIYMIAIDPPELRTMARVFQLFDVVPMTIAVSSIFVALSRSFFSLSKKLGWVQILP